MTNDMEIGSALALALADKVGQERYQLWFGSHTRMELADETLIVHVANRFFQDWLRTNFRQQIEASCLEMLGKALNVRFHVDSSLEASSTVTAPAACGGGQRSAAPRSDDKSVAGAARRGGPLRPAAELKTFVPGPASRIAYAAALTVAARRNSPSPVVLHGPTGVGKTHLLRGMCEAVRQSDVRAQAVYMTAEQFTTLFLEALHGAGLPSFRRKHRGLDLLAVDDIQFFAGKRATLTELLNTVDCFQREGRQLVFAADRPPAQLGSLGAELVTRLQGGLVCGIESPEYETRLAIVKQMAEQLGLAVPQEVQALIASNLHSHARELSGALHRLAATSRALERPISPAMAQEALADLLGGGNRHLRLADIERAVCEEFGLEPQALQSTRKAKEVSGPRAVAMYLARKHTRCALSEIGHHFGRRSHSTVISAQKKVNGWMSKPAALGEGGRLSIEEALRRVERRLMAG
ncbi:MAG: chromosomal replication initiator protein DnaA [Pirellulales bacterium]